ncbi:hypothetical protein N431DRAFT_449664 [Stipitochalara longipes BDJ]|nr:hypothetical protein N431DRAFT_449664 [Stipitochalara longipes BDJ]
MSNKKNSKKRKRLPIDMRIKGKKKKKGSQKVDYLTNMPNHILLQILSNVPMSSFLDLSQTHPQLRWFMHYYAAIICNYTLITRFSGVLKGLGATEIEGWMTPTNGLVHIKPREGSRWVVPGLQLHLYEPGPQFLYFAEKEVPRFECGAVQRFLDGLNKETRVVYGGEDYPRWVWLREMVWYHGVPS